MNSNEEIMRVKANPIKLIIRGWLDSKTVRLKVQRGRKTTLDQTFCDGYKLEQLEIGARLYCREDVQQLIHLLEIHKFCLPFENGSYQKPSK